MIASKVNETNELSSAKSFFLDLELSTDNPNVSPVIDLGRASVNLIGNRINNIDSSSDVYPTLISMHLLNQMVTRMLQYI